MTPKHQNASEQLSFAMYAAANRMVRLHKPILAPLNLTFPQYLAVVELLHEAPLSVGALGGRLAMDTGTITPLLKRLDAAGLLTRKRDPTDERRVMVELTPRGLALESEIRAVPAKIKTACRITQAELVDLRQKIEALAHPSCD